MEKIERERGGGGRERKEGGEERNLIFNKRKEGKITVVVGRSLTSANNPLFPQDNGTCNFTRSEYEYEIKVLI